MERTARIIGVPIDYGADRRGVDMGPSAIRYAGLADALDDAGVRTDDAGDLSVPKVEGSNPDAPTDPAREAKYLEQIEDVCRRLTDAVSEAVEAGTIPLVLGGDHSLSIGSVNGSSRGDRIGVVWLDAHGDFNTPETTPSGNVHGMSLAALLGLDSFDSLEWANSPSIEAQNVALVGVRDLDEGERRTILDSDVTALTMSAIDDRGVVDVIEEAIRVAADGTDGVHVSLDLDWLDPHEAPGVGTPVRGGVTYREAHAALEVISRWDRHNGGLRSVDVVEVNPVLDQYNETASLATELVASLFGKQIL